MRILFTRFPLESARGGAERQTLSLMKGLRARGHDVSFLGSCPALLAMCAEEGIATTELRIGPPPVSGKTAWNFLWKGKAMRARLMKALDALPKPDAIVMLSLSEKILLTDEAAKRGVRVFWWEHDRVGRWLKQNPWLSNLRKLSRVATTIVVSDLSKTIYERLGFAADRIVAIPNGIDIDRWMAEGERSMGSTHAELKLGCVARLSPEKGIDVLIDAIKDLTDVALTILGTGPEESALRTQAGRNERITFTDCVDDLGAFYRALDALVLPSRDHDPFGLVAAEAMACGVPVAVTDACGIAGYLRDGTDALVVAAGSPGALGQAIERLRDPTLRERLGRDGRETATRQFSADRMLHAYERILTAQKTD